jgi:hypothetical protein
MGWVFTIQGENGTGKSSFPLTWPGRVFYFDLEYGSQRATSRYDGARFNIWQPSIDLSALHAVRGDLVKNKIEQYKAITEKLIEVLRGGEYGVVVFDTHKELWSICNRAELQRKQMIQIEEQRLRLPGGKGMSVEQLADSIHDLRQSLQSHEYAAPNEQMKAIIDVSRMFPQTDLVLINHLRDVYTPQIRNGQTVWAPSGQKEGDGWSHVMDLTDWGLHMEIRFPIRDLQGKVTTDAKFIGTIVKSPAGAGLLGMSISNPDRETLMNMLRLARNGASV